MVIRLKIGSITLASAAALAPMAGVADRAFRELCVRFGAAYVVGEMVSAKGITMGDRKSAELLSLSEAERPAAIQLFGDDPSIMAEAAQKALFYRPQAIDINMGCPAPKVVRSGGGSSLMRRPETAQAVVEAAVRAVDIPVTVKIRAGWEEKEKNAVEIAKRCEAAGAAAITVHGRTREQMYAPPVDLEIIRQVQRCFHPRHRQWRRLRCQQRSTDAGGHRLRPRYGRARRIGQAMDLCSNKRISKNRGASPRSSGGGADAHYDRAHSHIVQIQRHAHRHATGTHTCGLVYEGPARSGSLPP